MAIATVFIGLSKIILTTSRPEIVTRLGVDLPGRGQGHWLFRGHVAFSVVLLGRALEVCPAFSA